MAIAKGDLPAGDLARKTRGAESRFDALLDASPDGILITDTDGRIETANAAAERLFGFAEDEMIGCSMQRLLVDGDPAASDAEEAAAGFLSTLRADQIGSTREYIAKRADGSTFPVEFSVGHAGDAADECFIAVVRDTSRRQEAAAALARSDSNLRMAQSLSHMGSFEFIIPDGGDAYCSDEVFRILGRDPARGVPSMQKLGDEVVHPEDRERVAAAVEQTLNRGGLLNIEYRIVRPGGAERFVQTACRATPATAPDTWRISGTMLDVTDRQQVQQALRLERDRAQTYLDLVGVMVIALDLNGNITLVNRQGLKTLCCGEEDVLGRNFFQQFVLQEHRDEAIDRFRLAIASGPDAEPQLETVWLQTCDSGRRLVRWRNKSLIDEHGVTIGLLGAGEDITEQRQMEDQLRQAEEELRLTFKHAPIGMATLDIHGSITSLNQSLCHMLRYREHDLLDRRILEVIHPADRDVTQVLRKQLLDGEVEYFRQEKRYIRADGSVMYGVARYSLVHDHAGNPLMFVAQIVDRTEQMEAEVEVRQHRERLGQVSRLGTMGEMAAGIAHELNQPLTAISSYVQACQRLMDAQSLSDKELRSVLAKVHEQAQRAGRVIQGLRSFVKKRAISRRATDIHRVIEDVHMLAEMDAKAHGISIEIDDSDDLAPVQADPIQLQQVLLNLVRNAVDAMVDGPNRDKAVQIEARRGGHDEIELSVIDFGSGVPADVSGRLFDPFFTTKKDGMGMGLSLSRSIVEAHGGRLSFTDNPAGGTVFTVVLPTLPEQEQ